MKKTRRPQIHTDARRKLPVKYANKAALPPEWAEHLHVDGSTIQWDGVVIGQVARGGVTYRSTTPDGKMVRKFSRAAAIQHLLDSRT